MSTDIEISQKACVLVGIEPITSFTDQSTEAIVLSTIYEDLVEAELADYPWRFAMQEQQIDRLQEEPETTWAAAYQIPSDILIVQTVKVNGSSIRYDRFGDNIFCDAGVDEEVFIQGIVRVDEELWPPYFRMGMIYRLASVLASGVREDGGLAQAMNQQAEVWIRKAKTNSSQAQSTRTFRSGLFLNTRAGSITRRIS